MSALHRIRFESNILPSYVLALVFVLVAPIVSAGPKLWLYPREAGPREGGHVVPPGDFTLVIENRAQDSEANNAQAVELVISVNKPDVVDTLELEYNGTVTVLDPTGWEVGSPTLPCSEKPMAGHGVYPAAFLEILLVELTGIGDLDGGQRVEIEVSVEGGDDLRVHFDAMAIGYKKAGHAEKCFDISNPAGHDVTVANRRGGQDGCGHVSITKTADPTAVDLGTEVVFTIEIVNDGTCDLTELVLEDLIPAVEDDQGSYPAFQWTGDTTLAPNEIDPFLLEWPLDALLVGDSAVVELVVLFDEPAADQRKVVNRACVSAAELKKRRCAVAVVTVGNPYGEDGPAGPGFWCHATRWILDGREKLPVDGQEMFEWLFSADDLSQVFSELEEYRIYFDDDPDGSIDAAADLLCTPRDAAGPADRLARHLLVLWLNVVSGRVDGDQTLGGLCTGDEILPDGIDPEMTVWELLAAAETDLVEEANDGQLTFWSEVIDAVNNSFVAGEGQCADHRKVSSRHRLGSGWPHNKSAASKTKN